MSSALIGFDQLAGTAKKKQAARAQKWAQVRPHAALLYVENRCHLKCDHCYESEQSHPKEHSLSLDDYRRILDELAALGVIQLTFSGGEIFLRRDMLELIAEARQRRFSVELFTTGTHIDEKKADRLAALQVSKVEVTLYSHLAETHDGFTRIPGSHARTVRALRLLRERGVRTALKANLMTFNVDHIDGLIALADEVGADWSFDPTVKPKMDGNRDPLKYALSPREIRQKVLSRPDLYSAFRRFQPGELCDGTASIVHKEGVMCGAARSHLAIGADGSVLGCGFFATAAGNVKDAPLADIWFGSAQLDAVRDMTFDKMSTCSSCEVKSSCGPCMAYSDIEDGDIDGCSSSSRQLAEAAHELAQLKVKKNAAMARGKALTLVGDTTFEPPAPKGRLDTEP